MVLVGSQNNDISYKETGKARRSQWRKYTFWWAIISLRTKIIGEIDFKAPAHQEDIIEIGVEAIKFGTTSITMRAEVRNKNTKQIILTIDKIVMVMVDENGKPKQHGKSAVRV